MAEEKKEPRNRRLTDKQIAPIIEQCGGVLSLVAQQTGYTYRNIEKRIKKSEYLQEVYNNVKERILDAADNLVVSAITTGVISRIEKDDQNNAKIVEQQVETNERLRTAKWYLERKGKDRGYTTRTEQTGKDGNAIVSEVKHKVVFEKYSE